MIGLWGFMEELSFVVFPLFLLALVAFAVMRVPKANGGYSTKGVVVLLVLIALPAVSGWRFAREVEAHLFLKSLSVEGVESFSIGGQRIAEPEKKLVLITALRDSEWFSPHHDGWAQPVDFQVRLKSGEVRHFRVATYLRAPGVVIDLRALRGDGGLHPGYAFSSSLSAALGKLDVDLPQQPK